MGKHLRGILLYLREGAMMKLFSKKNRRKKRFRKSFRFTQN